MATNTLNELDERLVGETEDNGSEEGYEDVDWEDEEDEDTIDDRQQSLTVRISVPPSHQSLCKDNELSVKSQRRQIVVKFTNDDLIICQERRQQQLLQHLEDAVMYWEAANDPMVSTAMCSLLPTDLSACSTNATERNKQHIQRLVLWFRANFKLLPHDAVTEEEGRDGFDDPNELLNRSIRHAAGTSNQLNQLFASMLLGLNYIVRYVTTLDGVSFSPYDHPDLYNMRLQEQQQQQQKKSPVPKELRLKKKKPLPKVHAWMEVQLIEENSSVMNTASSSSSAINSSAIVQWVQVDAAHKCMAHPEFVENKLRKGPPRYPIQYVIAIETCIDWTKKRGTKGNMLLDVTERYKFQYTRVLAKHQEQKAFFDAWLLSVIEGLSSCNSKAGSCIKNDEVSIRALSTEVIDLCDDDDGEVNDRKNDSTCISVQQEPLYKKKKFDHISDAKRFPMPTRFDDFKDHPVYLLQRHLRTNEMLHPIDAYKVGSFKGEEVYLQIHKEELRSKTQWRRFALRQVREDETPIKAAKRQVSSRKGESDMATLNRQNSSFETIEVPLYGSWQTEKIVIPPVKDDVIPVNEHGNVEVWDGNPSFLPRGSVFLPGSSALKAARSLDLPHAAGVVGFEQQGAQSIPKIGGAVVLEKHAEIIEEAMQYLGAVKEQQLNEKHEKKMISRWEKLVRSAMTRQRLREEYGH